MPECHSCPHYLAPRWKKVPFEKTPCATCELSDTPNHHGKSHVSRDSSDVVDVDVSKHLDGLADEFHGPMMLPIQEMKDGLKDILYLLQQSHMTAEIVLFRVCHPTRPLSEVARRLNISPQAAHARLKKAIHELPALKRIIHMKARG